MYKTILIPVARIRAEECCMMMRCVRSLLKRTMHSPVICTVLLCPHRRYRIFDCILNEPRNEDGRHMTGSAKSPFAITIRNFYHTRSLDGLHRDDRYFEKIYDFGIHDMYPDNSGAIYSRFFFFLQRAHLHRVIVTCDLRMAHFQKNISLFCIQFYSSIVYDPKVS